MTLMKIHMILRLWMAPNTMRCDADCFRASSNRFRQYFMAGLTFIRWSVNMRNVDSFAKFACLLVLEIQKKLLQVTTQRTGIYLRSISFMIEFTHQFHISPHFLLICAVKKKGGRYSLQQTKPLANDILSISVLFFYCSKIHSPWRKTLASLNHATTPKKPSSPKWSSWLKIWNKNYR